MSSLTQAVLGSWSLGFWPALTLAVSAVVYLRGWRVLRHLQPDRFPVWRAGAFLGGLGALILAIGSPVDALSEFLLSAHMVQHLLLMSVAAPLLLLGSPMLPILRGLPRGFAHDGLGPFLNWPLLRRIGSRLTHPIVGWLALVAGLCLWHLPAAFETALRSPAWHEVEHATFFLGAILFWWPVIRPYPSHSVWPPWTIPLYLLAADAVNSALCAILAFTEHVIYPTYAAAPRLFGTTALGDQASAGVIMWVPGSIAFLVPAVVVAVQYLSPRSGLVRPARPSDPAQSSAARSNSRVPTGSWDLLRLPLLGNWIRSLAFRRTLQGLMFLLAAAVILDGFTGPRSASANLAGILPWTFGRALAVIALLAAGNAFCYACPFLLPRELVRRLGLRLRDWPEALRSKWLAGALLASFFAAYEGFELWNRPEATAGLVLAYFITATLVDSLFRGASFCKYVCPIGQFNFLNSLVSPLEVTVREPDACVRCRTHDCLRGNETHRGCELDLHLPRKVGNLDCTMCLDCVRACPHDNLGILANPPAATLRRDPVRSSIGRLSQRSDLAWLALMVVASSLTTTAVMTLPMADTIASFTSSWNPSVRTWAGLLSILGWVGVVPVLLLRAVAFVGHRWGHPDGSVSSLAHRLSFAMVPLGAGLWGAHLLFHFLTAGAALGPALLRFLRVNAGAAITAMPSFGISPETLLSAQTLLLGLGLLLSLHSGWSIASEETRSPRGAIRTVLPWALLTVMLYGLGFWSLLQPMALRGIADIPLNR